MYDDKEAIDVKTDPRIGKLKEPILRILSIRALKLDKTC